MRLPICVVCLAFACWTGSWSARAEAAIEGVVALGPAVQPIPANARYQVKTSGPVAAPEPTPAVVYLEGKFAEGAPPPPIVRVEQRRFQFLPGVLAVQKGTRVEFPNGDEDYHNVFSFSKPKRFDLGRYRKDENPPAQTFDRVGVVKLYCEIHEHMRGAIVVVDSPHFQKTDANGKFRLEKLPAGKFTLKVWRDDKPTLEKVVELKDGETLRVEFADK